MKLTHHNCDTTFLKHRFPLSEDRIAKLVLPIDLTADEADRLSDLLHVLSSGPVNGGRKQKVGGDWPFDLDDDIEVSDLEDDDDFADDDEVSDVDTPLLTEADFEDAVPRTLTSKTD